jgi:hypothetical protein
MKTLFIIILFGASLAYADDTNITSKVFEKRDTNGMVNFRMETVYRGKTKVLMTISRPNKDGAMVVTSRNYLVGGDLVLTEADDRHDGTLQTIAIYHPGNDDMEVFTRLPDGSVKPVSTKTLQAYKKQIAALPDFMDWYQTKTNMTNAELEKLVKETQKKILDAEKEKDDRK